MSERWATPVIPLGYEEVGKRLIFGNRLWEFTQFVLSHDDVERIRFGYVCIHCLEQHDQPYPVKCSICQFPMRAIQAQVFERLYAGEEQIGPSVTLGEEMGIAQEMVERGGRE